MYSGTSYNVDNVDSFSTLCKVILPCTMFNFQCCTKQRCTNPALYTIDKCSIPTLYKARFIQRWKKLLYEACFIQRWNFLCTKHASYNVEKNCCTKYASYNVDQHFMKHRVRNNGVRGKPFQWSTKPLLYRTDFITIVRNNGVQGNGVRGSDWVFRTTLTTLYEVLLYQSCKSNKLARKKRMS